MNMESSEREWLEKKCVRVWKRAPHVRDNFLGTGFLITSRHIVTAAHVVAKYAGKTLYVTGRAWASERTVQRAPEYPEPAGPRKKKRDVAVLTLAADGAAIEKPIELADKTFLNETRDAPVIIGGFAKHEQEGLKILRLNQENYDNASDAIVISGPVEPGMSGGPAVRQRRFVGIVYATSNRKHKSYIIPLSSIRIFLKKYILRESAPVFNRCRKLPTDKAWKFVKYIDREPQLADLIRFIYPDPSEPWHAPLFWKGPRLIAAILPCMEKDRHHLLRGRFADGEHKFDPECDYAYILTGMPIYDVEIPRKEPKKVDIALYRMKERLRSSLSARSVEPGDIREALNKRQSPQGVFSTLFFKSGNIGPKREALINEWLQYWETVAGGEASDEHALEIPVIIILSVLTEPENEKAPRKKWSLLNWRRNREKSVEKWTVGWADKTTDSMLFDEFEELGSVTQSHIERWLEVFKKRNSDLCEVVDELTPQIASLVPVEGQPMDEIIDRTLKQLRIVESS